MVYNSLLFSYKNKFFVFLALYHFLRMVTIPKEEFHMSVQNFVLTQKSTKLEFPVPCFLLVFHSNNLSLSTIRFLSDVTHYKFEFFSSSFFR